MNEEDLRDCFAMFASLRIGLDGAGMIPSAERCYAFADAMLEARKKEDDEEGIVAIKKRGRKK